MKLKINTSQQFIIMIDNSSANKIDNESQYLSETNSGWQCLIH